MFVDASALVAILAPESDGVFLAERLRAAEHRYTSALALYEAALALGRIGNTALEAVIAVIDGFIAGSRIETIPITAQIGHLAVEAFVRFGRSNHPARLNMGDCFAYACARSLGVPLLAKGEDFRQTDITLA
jgi:ribonuclease VapC